MKTSQPENKSSHVILRLTVSWPSSSWSRTPFGADYQILHFFGWQLLSFLFMWGAFSDERMVCNLQCNYESSSYTATDGQSAISSRCRAPDQILIFFVLQLLYFFLM
jgi:hypothetical protein